MTTDPEEGKKGWVRKGQSSEASGEPQLSHLEQTRDYGLILTLPVPAPSMKWSWQSDIGEGETPQCGQNSESR